MPDVAVKRFDPETTGGSYSEVPVSEWWLLVRLWWSLRSGVEVRRGVFEVEFGGGLGMLDLGLDLGREGGMGRWVYLQRLRDTRSVGTGRADGKDARSGRDGLAVVYFHKGRVALFWDGELKEASFTRGSSGEAVRWASVVRRLLEFESPASFQQDFPDDHSRWFFEIAILQSKRLQRLSPRSRITTSILKSIHILWHNASFQSQSPSCVRVPATFRLPARLDVLYLNLM